MGDKTNIEWTDHTMNPWIGCTEVSPGCDHCYARTLATRYGWVQWGHKQSRRLTSDANWRKPLQWNRLAEQNGRRARVFCASLADVFDAEVPNEWRARLWELIRQTPYLDWQLLTKRPNLIARNLPADWGSGWPNVWLGTSFETQQQQWRVVELVKIPAVIHFLSCEPLLGGINVRPYLHGLSWVIAGGESGPNYRPMNLDWARSLRDQCEASGVSFFLKQIGGRTPKAGGKLLDGREWCQFPLEREVTAC